MSLLRILTADSHDVLRRGLRSLLTSHPGWIVCGEAKNGLEAVRLTMELKPDVVILCVEMTGLNGIEATRQIKRLQPGTEVLVYTAHDEEHIVFDAVKAGANAHVLKTDSESTLVEAISRLANHVPYFSSKAAQTLVGRLAKERQESTTTHALTDREREIVQLLSDSESNKQIAVRLQISVKTVEAHRAAIMRKLGFTSVTELVRYAIRNQLIEP